MAFGDDRILLLVSIVNKVALAPNIGLGCQVENIADTVKALRKASVKFERFPGMAQDDLGVWRAPSGAKVAWFKDPGGNILSITED